MAWLPSGRIPTAPLSAMFLTYHSLVPVSLQSTHFGVVDSIPGMQEAAGSIPGTPSRSGIAREPWPFVTPIVAFLWNNTAWDRWGVSPMLLSPPGGLAGAAREDPFSENFPHMQEDLRRLLKRLAVRCPPQHGPDRQISPISFCMLVCIAASRQPEQQLSKPSFAGLP